MPSAPAPISSSVRASLWIAAPAALVLAWIAGHFFPADVSILLLLGLACGSLAALLMLFRHIDRLAASQSLWNERLLQTQKLAALGELSSGLAHEINTPLAIIRQEAELIGLTLEAAGAVPGREDINDAANQIQSQVERCREITHSMLSFARKRDQVRQATDLGQLVEGMLGLLEREAKGRGIEIVREYAPQLPEVVTDAPQLRQVVLNLLNNAFQAIEGRGRLTVRTFATTDAASGEEQVAIAIGDTGAGISPENVARIFNPFFTTKPPGKGTGLGLSISLAIVTHLGGTIGVQSQPGQGSTFTIRLPRTAPVDPATAAPAA